MKKLKEVRKLSNLTGVQMAQKLCISKSYYFQIENGQRNLSYKLAVEIAKILNVKPDELFLDEFLS